MLLLYFGSDIDAVAKTRSGLMIGILNLLIMQHHIPFDNRILVRKGNPKILKTGMI